MKAVAYEFTNDAGHAIVDYTDHTHAGHLTPDRGYKARPLMYVDAVLEALATLQEMSDDPWAFRSEEGNKKLRKITERLAESMGAQRCQVCRGKSYLNARGLSYPSNCPHCVDGIAGVKEDQRG